MTTLKERILKEMVEDEDTKLAREIYADLPTELKTSENFKRIQEKIKKYKEEYKK